MTSRAKVVLALGGGGSRGLAHLGVLRVIEREGIPIDGIVGTSVGAIVGAAYAANPDIDTIVEKTLGYLCSDRFRNDHFRRLMFGANDAEQSVVQSFLSGIRKSLNFASLIRKPAIFDGSRLREVVEEFVPPVDFEDLAIPFAVPAIDLKQPMEVLLSEGCLQTAVTASCSLPGFFPPVPVDDMLLADVGVIGSVPVSAGLELVPGAVVVAIDLTSAMEPVESIERGWDSIMRCECIASAKLNQIEMARADVTIRPELGPRYWSDFSDLEAIVESGARATADALSQIRQRLEGVFRFMRVRSATREPSGEAS